MSQKHTQLLVEGMTSDAHPSLQPQNSYRYGLNGNLISHGGNNYSFESTEGTTLNWSMPEHKSGEAKFVPIGWFRLGNNLIVHSTDDVSSTGGAGEIGIVTFNNAGVGTYSAKYYHEDLRYTQAHMIFGYGLEENSNYHRSYWTDNHNQPRTINTASAVLSTEYTSGGLVVGQQYMVLTDSIGSIEHPVGSGNFYGPKQALGNIFTASFTTFTTVGSAKIIGYLDPAILDYTPSKAIGSIEFLKYTYGGSLFCGVKMYAYQLSTDDGYESSWSFTMNPVHVSPSNPSSGTQNYEGRDGSVNSGKAVQLTINDIPTIFTKIKVAAIEIDDSIDVISNIEIFWFSDITGTSMTITHFGQENLLPIDIDDISLRNAVIAKCKDITTLKQRQIIANITEREELSWSPTGATISTFTYEMPCDRFGLQAEDLKFDISMCPSAGFAPASGLIHPGGHYVVRGSGDIIYGSTATLYAVGDTFIGESGYGNFVVNSGFPIVKGCIRIKNYDKFAGGQSYKIIDLEDDFFDFKGMASHTYLRSYWREETYRIAALAWDKFGNPYAARWIDDITIEGQSDSSGNYGLTNSYDSDTKFTIKSVGLRIDGLDITSIANEISGISIVRVPRDKTILAQSLLMQMVDLVLGTTTCPVSGTVPANDNWAAANGNVTTAFTWGLIGPEFDFDLAPWPLPLISGDKLNPVSSLSPLIVGVTDAARVIADQDIYSKYYTHNRYVGNDSNLVYVKPVGDGASVSYSAGGFPYTFKNHDIATAGFYPDPLGATTAGGLQSKGAVGGERVLVLTEDADFVNTLTGLGTGVYGNGIGSNRKLLTNYVRPKSASSLYGGASDVAKANNKYIFTGHYLKVDSTVLSDIDDGSGNYVLNGIEVFGGDCFVNLYDRVSSMFNSDYNSTLLNNGSYSWGLIFPCESNINVGLRQGRHMCKDGLMQSTNGVLWKDAATGRGHQPEQFTYNTAYSSENSQIQYDALPVGVLFTARFPYMARYSEQKVLGESIDNMRIFLINNFKNADALHGEINNVAVGFDRLFYWQSRGIGYFPVEEREQMVGALGQAVQLGVGGVMQRADTMDKFYGNQHQSSLIIGEDFFEWCDLRRFAILKMSFNGGISDISVIKGMSTFLQNVFTIAEPDASNILNMDQPILGQGIIGVYDPIKKTAYHTFKFSSSRTVIDGITYLYYKDRSFTLGISSLLSKFVGFFSFTPSIYIEHDSRVYAAKKLVNGIAGSTAYSLFDEVSKDGSNYVCILPFTSATIVLPAQEPDASGSIYWLKTGEPDQVHRMFNGDICKFFGIVYPHKITLVVNPAIEGQKTFDAAEAYGNSVGCTDVFCETEDLSSSDENIQPTNKNYVYYDGKWNFNYPMSGRQRLTNQYMLVTLQVKNYVTSIVTSTNLQKRLVFLKTIFRLRK